MAEDPRMGHATARAGLDGPNQDCPEALLARNLMIGSGSQGLPPDGNPTMRRSCVLILAVLSCVTVAISGPVEGRKTAAQQYVEPYDYRTYSLVFEAGQRARVIVSGNGATFMGLYVFDEHGNCVARDDQGQRPTQDDLVVEWLPARTARYRVEVRNFGAMPNSFSMALQ